MSGFNGEHSQVSSSIGNMRTQHTEHTSLVEHTRQVIISGSQDRHGSSLDVAPTGLTPPIIRYQDNVTLKCGATWSCSKKWL